MKYVGVADDIIYAKTGDRVDAQYINVPLTFGDLGSIEIDLSTDTYRQIREMLKPIFAAVESPDAQRKVDAPRTPEIPPHRPGAAMVTDKGETIHVTREMRHSDGPTYKAGCRAWARKTGRSGEINKYYFPAGLLADFDAYLSRNGG